jgi:hypothetical protein
MIEDEDRAADDAPPPPAANDNCNGDTSVRIDAASTTSATTDTLQNDRNPL